MGQAIYCGTRLSISQKSPMKPKYRIILGISVLISLIFVAPALSIFQSITSDPMGWQAGVSLNSTIAWFATIVVGYGFLMFQNVLAVFGIIFIKKSRRAAFWLLVLPGFIGIVLGLVSLGLLIAFDAEWPASWPINVVLLAPPITAFVIGRRIRQTK